MSQDETISVVLTKKQLAVIDDALDELILKTESSAEAFEMNIAFLNECNDLREIIAKLLGHEFVKAVY